MNAHRSPGVPGGNTGTVVRPAVWLALVSSIVSVQVGAQEPITAVWKEREIDFLYRSSTNIYECGTLRDRVRSILVAVGARPDMDVKVSNCDHFTAPQDDPRNDRMDTWQNPSDPWHTQSDWSRNGRLDNDRTNEQQANVRIRLMTPVEVTPQVLEEQKKEKTRRELVARVTGNRDVINQATGEFPAQWQSVTLSRSTIGLEPEECELLDQMSTSVFRKLGIREVAKGMVCNPRQTSHIAPKLTVKALISTPWGPSPAPTSGESAAQPGSTEPAETAPSEPATQPPK
ncbi:MAG: hypothetical protein ABW110_16080 [Steroidobacteraceae bacterium]